MSDVSALFQARSDADAKAMLKKYNNIPMPNQSLTEAEIKQYLKYFEWIDAQPAGTAKNWAAYRARFIEPALERAAQRGHDLGGAAAAHLVRDLLDAMRRNRAQRERDAERCRRPRA